MYFSLTPFRLKIVKILFKCKQFFVQLRREVVSIQAVVFTVLLLTVKCEMGSTSSNVCGVRGVFYPVDHTL